MMEILNIAQSVFRDSQRQEACQSLGSAQDIEKTGTEAVLLKKMSRMSKSISTVVEGCDTTSDHVQ
jgi:hypothetical protein